MSPLYLHGRELSSIVNHLRNYLPKPTQNSLLLFLSMFLLVLGACTQAPGSGQIAVTVLVDGKETEIAVDAGSTVQSALKSANIQVNSLDRLDPPNYSILTQNTTITITRIREEYDVEEVVIPFEKLTQRNESLAEGQTMLMQTGINGMKQITYRTIFEDNVQTSRSVFKEEIINDARPEIVMVGVQSNFTPFPFIGKMAYLSSGNAWLMEENSGKRRMLVANGQLDGRILKLSPNAEWLLYTQKEEDSPENRINSLWVINLNEENANPIPLGIYNVIHFADWLPGAIQTILYSTVEPRSTPPGWQANNDLQKATFTLGGMVRKEELVEAGSGGIYGWWGTNYAIDPYGDYVAYARPDGIGLIDLEDFNQQQILDILPYQTRSDWAWVPGIAWSADGSIIYLVNHLPMDGSGESSPMFDLSALIIEDQILIPLIPQSGMFAYPVTAPEQVNSPSVAYLQAIFPDKSEASNYGLVVMDNDGSNKNNLFPSTGSSGINPQQVIWSPIQNDDQTSYIAIIYNGNIWIINPGNGETRQLTGDGSVSKLDWK